ncbi:hypothetical protein JOQ06_025566 [Pogonophryne albipinna]|uniref:Uncharacterized protein n=1 Tax=Pogonophryne albipinna TaxID=1090488 RepID=A0AAD6AUI2_9TELE|nr:hypothetical protein JOQ06_025566 [Pogonophryne albipinna]
MAREKLSVEERRRRNREYQRKRREKLNSDPEKKYAMQVEDRQRKGPDRKGPAKVQCRRQTPPQIVRKIKIF